MTSEQEREALASRELLDHSYGWPRMEGSEHPDAWPDPVPVNEEEEQHGDH